MEFKNYIGVFKVYNGEATYSILVKIEANSKWSAKMHLKEYECDNNVEIWQLRDVVQVKTFRDLWELI